MSNQGSTICPSVHCSACQYLEHPVADLKLYIRNVLAERNTGSSVNNLNSNGGFTLGFENVIDQILGSKIDIATSVGIVLAQHTLRVQTP